MTPERPEDRPLTEEEAAALLGADGSEADLAIVEPDKIVPSAAATAQEKPILSRKEVQDRRAKIVEYAEWRLATPTMLLRLLAMLNFGGATAVIVILALGEWDLLGPSVKSSNPATNEYRTVTVWFGFGLSAITLGQSVLVFFVTSAIRNYRFGTWVYLGLLIAMVPSPWIGTGFFYLFPAMNVAFVLVSMIVHGYCGGRVLRAMYHPDTVAAACIKRTPDQRLHDDIIDTIRLNGWLRPLKIGTILIGGIALTLHVGFLAWIADSQNSAQPQFRGMTPKQFRAYQYGMQVGMSIASIWSLCLFLSGLAIHFRMLRELALIGLVLCLLPGSIFWPIAFPFVVWGLHALFDRDVARSFEHSR